MNTNTDVAGKFHDNTDKSLSDERDKTDEHLERKSKTVEDATTKTIQFNRLAAGSGS